MSSGIAVAWRGVPDTPYHRAFTSLISMPCSLWGNFEL